MRNFVIGTTYTIGSDPNEMEWEISRAEASTFEHAIFIGIRNRIATLDDTVRVIPTPRTGDRGRDIEIEFRRPIELAGHRFDVPEGKEFGRIYVECKMAEKGRLNDAFLSDISQHEPGEIVAHILATNATITPTLHYRAVKSWQRIGAEFFLLDRWRLRNWLFSEKQPPLFERPNTNIEVPNNFAAQNVSGNGVVAHLLSQREQSDSDNRICTYLVVRNHSLESQSFSISTASELSWDSDVDLHMIISPTEDRVYRFYSRQQIFGYDTELSFNTNTIGRSTTISLRASQLDLLLEPIFCGEKHRLAQKEITSLIADPAPLKIISIEGEAGVGKSRTVSEALTKIGDTSASEVVWLTCSPDTGNFDFSLLWRRISDRVLNEIAPEMTASSMPYVAVNAIAGLGVSVIIIFEDLHHCSYETIVDFKRLISAPPLMESPCSLIVTGRNDFTFPNPDYFSFLEFIRLHLDRVARIRLEPLSEQDSRDLINSIVLDLPKAALEKINRIGQHNPFMILEVLQYLLDVERARLLSRQTIGIIDPERFSGKEGLPEGVQELYSLRFQALESANHGRIALDLLCLSSLYGHRLPIELFGTFFEGDRAEEVLRLLRRRRFLVFSPNEGSASFAHENLLHAARAWLLTRADARDVAGRLCENGMSAHLSRFQRGLLLALAERDDEAFEAFTPIWERLKTVSNFSSEEIDREYFQYLPFIFDVAIRRGSSPEELFRIASTRGYMGVHNFPLYQGVSACEEAIKWIARVQSLKIDSSNKVRVLRQLQAHALQNMGRTGESLRLMLEIKSEIEVDGIREPFLEYDLYDRLQEHYRKANHRVLMENYGQLAARAVALSKDEKLQCSHLITQSLAKIHDGRRVAFAAANRAIEASDALGIRRFSLFNRLTLLVAKTIYEKKSKNYCDLYKEALDLLRLAVTENFSDSIIRLELLLATLALHCLEDPVEARKVALNFLEAGREASVRYGIGLYGWALENLKAVILLEDKNFSDEDVNRAFRSCIDHLQRRGLLFVGCEGSTYPNVHAIANLIRFRASFSEAEALAIVFQRLSTYSMKHMEEREMALKLVLDAKSGKALFWSNSPELLRYPKNDGYFTPVF